MGFQSQDDLINQITNNAKYLRRDGVKTTSPVHTAGGWHNTMTMAGYPSIMTGTGTTRVWRSLDEFSGDGTTVGGIQHGGIPGGTATKHILSVGVNAVGATGAPWQCKLVDIQGYYPLTGVNVTDTNSRTLINTDTFTANATTNALTYANDWSTGTKVQFTTSGTLPAPLALLTDYWLIRTSATTATVASSYANYVAGTSIDITDTGSGTHTLNIQMGRYTNGVGCQAFFSVLTTLGGGGPTLSASSYTNSTPSTGRAFQGSVTTVPVADGYVSRIIHSGSAAGRYGPFLPLQGGDQGIAKIDSFTFSGGTPFSSGTLALCIARPLLDISVPITGMWSERDLVNQLPSLPRVQDGAFLAWLFFGAAATTTGTPITFAIDFGWGG